MAISHSPRLKRCMLDTFCRNMMKLSPWEGQFVSSWDLCCEFFRQVGLNWVFSPGVLPVGFTRACSLEAKQTTVLASNTFRHNKNWLTTKAAAELLLVLFTKRPSVKLYCLQLLCDGHTKALAWKTTRKHGKFSSFFIHSGSASMPSKTFPYSFSHTFWSLGVPSHLLFTWLKRRRQLIGQPELPDRPVFTCTPLLAAQLPTSLWGPSLPRGPRASCVPKS